MVLCADSDRCVGGWLQEPCPAVRSILRPHDDSTAVDGLIDRPAHRSVLPAAAAGFAIPTAGIGPCPATSPASRSANGVIGKRPTVASNAAACKPAFGPFGKDRTAGRIDLLCTKAVLDLAADILDLAARVFDHYPDVTDAPPRAIAVIGGTCPQHNHVHAAKFELQLSWIVRAGPLAILGRPTRFPYTQAVGPGRSRDPSKHSKRGPHA